MSDDKSDDVEFEQEGPGGRGSQPPAPKEAPKTGEKKKVDDLRAKLGLGTAKTLVAPAGKQAGALPGIPGIPGLGGQSAAAPGVPGIPGIPGIPGLPGAAGAARPAAAGRTLIGSPGGAAIPGVPGIPGIPGLPGVGGPARAAAGGVPGLPGMAPPSFMAAAAPAEPEKPEADKHDPFGTQAQPARMSAGAIDVEKAISEKEAREAIGGKGMRKKDVVLFAVVGVVCIGLGALVGWMLGGNTSRDKVVAMSHDHARKIQAGLEKVHEPKVKLYQQAIGDMQKRISDAMTARDPLMILTTIRDDRDAVQALQADFSKVTDLVGETMLIGNFSAFAPETVTPVLKAITLWNKLSEQMLSHAAWTSQGLERYAFQLEALSAAGFKKEVQCPSYIEKHKADTAPTETVQKTLASCQEFMAKFPTEKRDVTGLLDSAMAAYTVGQDLSAAMEQDIVGYFKSVQDKIGGPAAADALGRYLGPSRFVAAFEPGFWGALSEDNWTADLSKMPRLYTLDANIQILPDPVEHSDLGITSTAAPEPAEGATPPPPPAEGEEAPAGPVTRAKNMLWVTVGEGSGQKTTGRYLFILDPGQSGGWNDINGDEKFDNLDVDLFWESFRAKPELWAIVVDPAPALGLVDAWNARFLQEYAERLVLLGNTLGEIAVAVGDAIKAMGKIR